MPAICLHVFEGRDSVSEALCIRDSGRQASRTPVNDGKRFWQIRDTPTSSDSQPQIEIFADTKRFLEQSDLIEAVAPDYHRGCKDEAIEGERLKESPRPGEVPQENAAVSVRRSVEHATRANQPDIGLVLQERNLTFEFKWKPFVVCIEESNKRTVGHSDGAIPRGRHSPVNLRNV